MWQGFRNLFFGQKSESAILYRNFGAPDFISFRSEEEKLLYSISNPAFLKIASMQCDLFSLGKFKLTRNGETVENHPLLEVLKKPNFHQETSEFLWEWFFWLMLGCSPVRATANNFNSLVPPLLIPLEPMNLEFPKLPNPRTILTEESYNESKSKEFKYHVKNGLVQKIPGTEMIIKNDLGIDTSIKASRIEALLKIIQNNERTIDSQNINIRYAGRFMISGRSDVDDVSVLPMTQDEKEDIERKSLSNKPVEAVKSMIEIQKYVKDKMFLNLGEAYNQTYLQIGNMYGIPRDVLDAFNSSTFENQEKAQGRQVTYTLQPKSRVLGNAILSHFGMNEEFDLELSYDHLPFMQVFEKERMERKEKTIDIFSKLIALGVSVEQANEYLETNFEIDGRTS